MITKPVKDWLKRSPFKNVYHYTYTKYDYWKWKRNYWKFTEFANQHQDFVSSLQEVRIAALQTNIPR